MSDDVLPRRRRRDRQRARRRASRATERCSAAASTRSRSGTPRTPHVEQSSDDIWRAVGHAARAARRGRVVAAGRDRRHRLRRDVLARRDRRRRPAGHGQRRRRRRAERRRLDGPPRDRRCARDRRDRSSGAAVRRRVDLARDGDAEAALAAAQPARHLAPHRALVRPRRLPDLAGDRERRPFAVHDRVQVDVPRPRATLGPDVLRRRSGSPTSPTTASRASARTCACRANASAQSPTDAAAALGVAPGTPVATSLIDAHAGALGMLGAAGHDARLERRLAIIAGTSACHLALAGERHDVAGVWGPYYEAILPGHVVHRSRDLRVRRVPRPGARHASRAGRTR